MPVETVLIDKRPEYLADEQGSFSIQYDREGNPKRNKLANYTASIIEEICLDDGINIERRLTLSGQCSDKELPPITLTVEQFDAMKWAVSHWGTFCLTSPTYMAAQKLCYAIKALSNAGGEIDRFNAYAHTGWRTISGEFHYLSAGTVLTESGGRSDVAVQIDRLEDFCSLPPPSINAGDATEAARASYECLSCAPFAVAISLIGCAYLAPLSEALKIDFTLWIEAPSRSHKSSYAGLINAHFGPAIDYHRMACNWTDTATAIEHALFTLANTMVVVDDFAPKESRSEQDRLEGVATRVIRLVGNRASRGRGTTTGGRQEGKPSRAMVVATGEQYPKGESINSRLFGVTLGKHQVDICKLGQLQEKARNGLLARSMSDYICSLASDHANQCQQLAEHWRQWRTQAMQSGLDGRLPDQLAFIYLGFNQALNHWKKHGVIDEPEAKRLAAQAWDQLLTTAKEHGRRIRRSQPVDDLIDVLSSILQTGQSHLCDVIYDKAPSNNASLYGWVNGEAKGLKLGWVDETKGQIYLLPTAFKEAYAEAKRKTGEALTISWASLTRQMVERGIMQTKSETRKDGSLTHRTTMVKNISGHSQRVWVFDAIAMELMKGPE